MTRLPISLALAAACLLVVPAAQAATLSKADYTADKARIGDAYKADKSACNAQAGNAKDVCVEEAKAVQVKALADAKLGRDVRSAAREANEDKREADYKVAAEKCESLSGDARSACMAAARSRFGKT